MIRTIETTDDGSATLYVPELDEHYHSVKGARTESQHIFIDMGLKASPAPVPRVLEVGFGTGLNAQLTLEEAERSGRHVHYTGIERYPLTWKEISPLHYTDHPLFEALHRAPWGQDVPVSPHFTLRKIEADVHQALGNEERRMKNEEFPCGVSAKTVVAQPDSSFFIPHSSFYDVVYFDAFAPEKQPEMWSESLFRALWQHMSPGAVLTTYCAKGAVRRMLQSIGFRVERLPGPPGGKREILRAWKAK